MFDKSILTLTLPKKEEAKPRKITAKHKVAAKDVKTKKSQPEKAKTAEGKAGK